MICSRIFANKVSRALASTAKRFACPIRRTWIANIGTTSKWSSIASIPMTVIAVGSPKRVDVALKLGEATVFVSLSEENDASSRPAERRSSVFVEVRLWQLRRAVLNRRRRNCSASTARKACAKPVTVWVGCTRLCRSC